MDELEYIHRDQTNICFITTLEAKGEVWDPVKLV